jgi:type 1 fimbria pilin
MSIISHKDGKIKEYPMKTFTKNNLLVALMVFSGAASAFTGNEAHEFTVSGNLQVNPCVIDLPSTIDFGHINVDTLALSSSTSLIAGNTQVYNIQFTQCAENQMAQISVLGTGDSSDPTTLVNAATEESATNIAISFWDVGNAGKKNDVNTGSSAIYNVGQLLNDETSGSIHLQASLVRPTEAVAKPGNIAASAQINITYL